MAGSTLRAQPCPVVGDGWLSKWPSFSLHGSPISLVCSSSWRAELVSARCRGAHPLRNRTLQHASTPHAVETLTFISFLQPCLNPAQSVPLEKDPTPYKSYVSQYSTKDPRTIGIRTSYDPMVLNPNKQPLNGRSQEGPLNSSFLSLFASSASGQVQEYRTIALINPPLPPWVGRQHTTCPAVPSGGRWLAQ